MSHHHHPTKQTHVKVPLDQQQTADHPIAAFFERNLQRLEATSPFNLSPLTNHLRFAYVSRVGGFELLCSKNFLFAFLVRRGVSPVLLFLCVAAGAVLFLRRMFRKSNYLLINTLGVAYPAYRSLKALEESPENVAIDLLEGAAGGSVEEAGHKIMEEQRQWLTYWVVYGSMQVVDYWSEGLLDLIPSYNLWKLVILYWAQNDRSRGASVLYNYFLKPLIQKNRRRTSTQPAIPPTYPLDATTSVDIWNQPDHPPQTPVTKQRHRKSRQSSVQSSRSSSRADNATVAEPYRLNGSPTATTPSQHHHTHNHHHDGSSASDDHASTGRSSPYCVNGQSGNAMMMNGYTPPLRQSTYSKADSDEDRSVLSSPYRQHHQSQRSRRRTIDSEPAKVPATVQSMMAGHPFPGQGFEASGLAGLDFSGLGAPRYDVKMEAGF
ncbi:hypothetical protein BC938DRAFT_475203 [Jimgerdemannia flammicorona]|uniref:TB2/DP1, HVA22 family-domain-containing protein n=1 Tax=Jimgerdemannia flammicorona TaxID=994334 RepID=A0A433PYY3_9FUNG|nr:hypothetical protein BC938DRAFT_475203 [Jimgerdemannia flammicorona]RUS22718.1 hypothetical protein BC938DRAFT_475203 [Jimgerdemannia flammicorona]